MDNNIKYVTEWVTNVIILRHWNKNTLLADVKLALDLFSPSNFSLFPKGLFVYW